jgi:AraC-like DNA-binding protein
MQPGDVFVFSGNEPHCITKIFPGGLKLINLHFNWQFFIRSCPIGDRFPNMFFAHEGDFQNRIPAEKAGALKSLMEAVLSEFSGKKPEYESAVGAYLNLMFVELMRNHNYYVQQEAHRAVDKILLGVKYIDRHFTEDMTLEAIAEKSDITPNYFTKLFHDCFHVKLWDYITAKRIDEAKRLLSSREDMTILEIATACGFHNTANFNRAFLKFTGITPRDYKSARDLHH